MTQRTLLERWASMLRPLFPAHAEIELRPTTGRLEARWPPHSAVAIFIAPRALDDYREASFSIRSRADRNLLAFVKDNLRSFSPKQRNEFRIVVASIDFVPLR